MIRRDLRTIHESLYDMLRVSFAALRRYNDVRTLETRVQLRVALHRGEVYENPDGVVSHAVNLAFRILDAKSAKSALAQSGGMLALIASNDFFHDVIAQEPSAVPSWTLCSNSRSSVSRTAGRC
ncbi:hypothetical protein LWC34_34740 [Kibdelosporangium philippinense]|uniref:Uncharacterized protein n=1 Tax=Kibdelosporangium philippinense TaxID=211113 RepID=A0ABS8ZJJ2_9PSEU|nr:hypothetical protein [Kibdelosporangium philippinense]MCE7007941.1 hypothetical protein [Kibdelosporangium philippinense]